MKFCSEDRYLGFENIKDEYFDRNVNLKNCFIELGLVKHYK